MDKQNTQTHYHKNVIKFTWQIIVIIFISAQSQTPSASRLPLIYPLTLSDNWITLFICCCYCCPSKPFWLVSLFITSYHHPSPSAWISDYIKRNVYHRCESYPLALHSPFPYSICIYSGAHNNKSEGLRRTVYPEHHSFLQPGLSPGILLSTTLWSLPGSAR